MPSKLAMIVLAVVGALAACSGGSGGKTAPAEGPTQVRHVACDDGGSGGVMIDGVCL